MSVKFESFGSRTSDNDRSITSQVELSSRDKPVSQIDVLPSLRIVTLDSGEGKQNYFFKKKRAKSRVKQTELAKHTWYQPYSGNHAHVTFDRS